MKVSIRKIPLYLVVVAILLDNNTMWNFIPTWPLFGHGFGYIIAVCCVFAVLIQRKFSKSTMALTRLFILLGIFIVYAAFTRYKADRFLIAYVGTFVCFYFLSVSLYTNHSMKSFLEAYSNIILLIAVTSLFFWSFGSVLKLLPGKTPIYYYWADDKRVSYTYYYLYFENPIQNKDYGIIRNVGIFPEAPGYAGFLSYALIIELAMRKEDIRSRLTNEKKGYSRYIRILIYIITIVSTGSSKGIILVMIALFTEYVSKRFKTKTGNLLKWISGILAIFVVYAASYYLIEKKMGTSSGNVRMDDLTAGFKTWKEHFIFGAGFGNAAAIWKNQSVIRSNDGLSMGLAVLVAEGGLVMLLVYLGAGLYSFFSSFFRKRRKLWIVVFSCLFFDLFISNGAFDNPFIFIIAAAYALPHKASSIELHGFDNQIIKVLNQF